jgi:hypothetical protein
MLARAERLHQEFPTGLLHFWIAVDTGRTTNNLSSAIRVFVFNHFYALLKQENFLNGGQRNLEASTASIIDFPRA